MKKYPKAPDTLFCKPVGSESETVWERPRPTLLVPCWGLGAESAGGRSPHAWVPSSLGGGRLPGTLHVAWEPSRRSVLHVCCPSLGVLVTASWPEASSPCPSLKAMQSVVPLGRESVSELICTQRKKTRELFSTEELTRYSFSNYCYLLNESVIK